MNPADTAWMLISTALVLLMTPALAFFYGGLVRSKNALNTMMMSFVSLGIVGVLWAIIGYSLAAVLIVLASSTQNPVLAATFIALAASTCMLTTAPAWSTCVDIGREIQPSDPLDRVLGQVVAADTRAMHDTVALLDLAQVATAWLVPDLPSRMRPPTPVRGLVHDGNIEELRRRALDPTLRRPTSTPADKEAGVKKLRSVREQIVAGKADACFGSRFLGGPHRVLYYWHSVGNTVLTLFSNMLTNLNLTDMETCYKAVRGELARSLVAELRSDRFGFEPEITARLARRAKTPASSTR